MNDKLKESIERFEATPPFDPFTFSAKHPERATKDYDSELAKKSEPDYDKLRFDTFNELMTQ